MRVGASPTMGRKKKHTIRNFDDMADTLPGLMHLPRVAQSELVASCQANFPAFQLGQHKPCHPLLIQAQVPPHSDVCLCLALLQSLIVICFNLDQRPEDVLILICILVAQKNGLRLVINSRLLEVLEGCLSVLAPQVLETVNLLKRDLTGAQLFSLRRRFDKPREERSIVDERCPESCIPRDVLGNGRARLATQISSSRLRITRPWHNYAPTE